MAPFFYESCHSEIMELSKVGNVYKYQDHDCGPK